MEVETEDREGTYFEEDDDEVMGGAGAFVDNCTDDNEQDQIEGCEEDSIQNENEESSLPDCGDLDFCESLDQENGEKLEDEDFHEDYSCEVCEGSFMHLTDLFKHFENHDTDEYAYLPNKPISSSTLFGSFEKGEEVRKWPSRFLKFPSLLFRTLSEFSEGNGRNERKIDDYGYGSNPCDAENNSSESSERIEHEFISGRVMKPRNHAVSAALMNRLKIKFPIKRAALGNSLLTKRTGKFSFLRKRYKCPQCEKEFQRSDHFKSHLNNHSTLPGHGVSLFSCKFCGRKFSAMIALRKHMGTHAGYKSFKCSNCPRRFTQSIHLKRHEASPFSHIQPFIKGDNRRKCRLCFETFSDDNTRSDHEKGVHGIDGPSVVFKCRYPTCRQVQASLQLLIDHYKRYHTSGKNKLERSETEVEDVPIQKALCNLHKVPNGKPAVSQSLVVKTPVGTEECRMCFAFLPTISERNHHESSVHEINSPTTVLQCKYADCRKILGAKNWLARHIREHRQRINEGMEPNPSHVSETQPPQSQEVTEQIGVGGSSDGEWEEEEPWYCRLCDQRFLAENERAVHERHLHDTDNPTAEFLCKLCSEEVGNFYCLLIHLETHTENQAPVHPKPKTSKSELSLLYPCRHCDLIFNDQQVRLTHEYDVHDTKDALDNFYPCKICSKVMTLRGLRKHLRRIHGESPTVEENSGTAQGVDAKVERPSKQKSTPHLPAPITHAPAKANLSKASAVPTCNVIYKRTNEPTTAAWVCRLCSEQFDEQRQRETHEHSVHGTNAPNTTFLCKYSKCDLEFGTFRALTKHLRGEHGETAFPTAQPKLPTPSLTQYKPPALPSSALVQNDSNDSLLSRCRLCWEVFPSHQHRLSHEHNSHQTQDSNTLLKCKFCPKNFSGMKSIVKHLESHGEVDVEENIDGEEEAPPTLQLEVPQKKPPSPVICRLCDAEFPHVKARITHEHMAHSTKNMRQEQTCKLCGTTLPNFRQLLGHFQSEHKGKDVTVTKYRTPS